MRTVVVLEQREEHEIVAQVCATWYVQENNSYASVTMRDKYEEMESVHNGKESDFK